MHCPFIVADCSMHGVFLKVMGDVEGVDSAVRTVPCPGQGSATQREDKEGAGAPHLLRKRKKLFRRECQPHHCHHVFITKVHMRLAA